MRNDLTDKEMIKALSEKMHLQAIKAFAEMEDVEHVLKEAEALFYERSYACYCNDEDRKNINYLYEMCYELNGRMTELEKKLDNKIGAVCRCAD